MNPLIENNFSEIVELCKSHKVKSLAVFGSAVKKTMHEKSDIDFLVYFSEKLDVFEYADNYFSLLDSLQLLFKTPIDLVSLKSLKNPILLKEIQSSKVELYAA